MGTADSRGRPSRTISRAIDRSIVHWVDHMPARRQWSMRNLYSCTAADGSPERATMDAIDAPAIPVTNDAPVASAAPTERAKGDVEPVGAEWKSIERARRWAGRVDHRGCRN